MVCKCGQEMDLIAEGCRECGLTVHYCTSCGAVRNSYISHLLYNGNYMDGPKWSYLKKLNEENEEKEN